MQGSLRNTGAYKSGAAEVDDKMRARAFEPCSRSRVPGGLLEARLAPNGRAGAPRTGSVCCEACLEESSEHAWTARRFKR